MSVAKNRVGDEALLAATGRHPDEWFRLLDAEDAASWTHTEIARWLVEMHAVDGWWSQSITVRFEQARGMRKPGQQADGTFSVSASCTLPGEVHTVLERVIETFTRALGSVPTSVGRSAKYPTARWKLERGGVVLATLTGKNDRTSVSVSHQKLPEHELLNAAKTGLRDLLAELAASPD